MPCQSLEIWQLVQQGNQPQEPETMRPQELEKQKNQRTTRTTRIRRTREPQAPENHENQKNQRTTRTRRTTEKNGTRKRFHVTKSNKRNVTSAVAITLEISQCYCIITLNPTGNFDWSSFTAVNCCNWMVIPRKFQLVYSWQKEWKQCVCFSFSVLRSNCFQRPTSSQ